MVNPYTDEVLGDGAVLLYPLLERSGSVAEELANDLDGTYGSGADPDIDGPFPGVGNVGAVEFSATVGDHVSIAPVTMSNGRSIEFWVSPDSFPGSGVSYIVAGADTAGNFDTFLVGLDTQGRVYAEVAFGAGGSRTCRNNTVLSTDGTWHFVVVWYESNLVTVEVDGSTASLTRGGSGTIPTFTTDAQFMGGDSGFGLPAIIGRVGSMSFFPTVLTAQQREDHYLAAQDSGASPPGTPSITATAQDHQSILVTGLDTADADSHDVRWRKVDTPASITQDTSGHWGQVRLSNRSLTTSGTHDYRYDGTGVRIYVIDTGIRATHDEFESRVIAGYDVHGQTSPAGHGDTHGHGTGIASLAAGATLGMAKNATIVPVRVSPNSYTSGVGDDLPWEDYLDGFEWIRDNHPTDGTRGVVANANALYDLTGDGAGQTAISGVLQDLWDMGILVCQSAGNENESTSRVPTNLSQVLTISGTQENDTKASFSNFGDWVQLWTPATGLTVAGTASDSQTVPHDAGVGGTSFCAPLVAGIAACLLEANPNATPELLVQMLLGQATDLAVGPMAYSLTDATEQTLVEGIETSTWLHQGLESETEYGYESSAVNASGSSGWSTEITEITEAVEEAIRLWAVGGTLYIVGAAEPIVVD